MTALCACHSQSEALFASPAGACTPSGAFGDAVRAELAMAAEGVGRDEAIAAAVALLGVGSPSRAICRKWAEHALQPKKNST